MRVVVAVVAFPLKTQTWAMNSGVVGVPQEIVDLNYDQSGKIARVKVRQEMKIFPFLLLFANLYSMNIMSFL